LGPKRFCLKPEPLKRKDRDVMTWLSILVFIFIFGLFVFVHELGHFWAAIKSGVKVEEFGFGLPPRIWGTKKHGVIYSINWIPFGGFVRIKGEGVDGGHDPDSLKNKSYGVRILVTVGGVLMNFLTAFGLLMFGFWLGMPPIVSDASRYAIDNSQLESQILIVHVDRGTPAELAGIKAGDIVVTADGIALKTVPELQQAIAGKRQVNMVVRRDQERLTLPVTTIREENREVIGVLADELVSKVHYTWWKVPYFAILETGQLIKNIAIGIVDFLASLVSTGSLPDSVAGPVGIAKITAQAVALGFLSVLQFAIFLNVNLGLINIVPFPALDGGRLLFLLIEISRGGRRIKPEIENAIHSFGFLLLLALIFVVTYRDIFK